MNRTSGIMFDLKYQERDNIHDNQLSLSAHGSVQIKWEPSGFSSPLAKIPPNLCVI